MSLFNFTFNVQSDSQHMEKIMTTVAEIKAAIAAEAADVKASVDALEKTVTDLKDALAAGTPVSEADMADILAGVQGIFTAKP